MLREQKGRPSIKLDGRQESAGNFLEEPLGLISIGPHVDFLDPKRNLLLLQKKPNFLTIWAPRGGISVEHDPYLAFILGSKQADLVVSVSWS